MGALYTLPNTITEWPISLEKAKKQLKLPSDDLGEDELLQDYIEAAFDDAERYIEHDIIQKKYKYVLDGFPDDAIVLPKNPVISIDVIEYVDVNGDVQVLPSDKYDLIPTENNNEKELKFSDDLPDVKDNTFDAVRISFTTGFESIPKAIIQAVLLILSNFYENRADGIERLPKRSESLLRKYRKYA